MRNPIVWPLGLSHPTDALGEALGDGKVELTLTPVYELVELVFAPEGPPESSPALQCRVGHLKEDRPVGTVGNHGGRVGGAVDSRRHNAVSKLGWVADRWCGASLPSVPTGRKPLFRPSRD